MPSRILVLHGPNLNLVVDLEALDRQLEARAAKAGIELKTFQANSEGVLVDALHAERTKVSGFIVNAAKLAPTAHVLAEAIELVKRPAVEVLLESGLRSRSALKEVVLKQLTGKDGYLTAVDTLVAELKKQQLRPTGTMLPVTGNPQMTMTDDENTGPIPKDEVKKTLGRRIAAEAKAESDAKKKTIGRGDRAERGDGTQKIAGALSRAMVREKIAERLSGKLSPAGLATWARAQWQQIQRGSPVESGSRDHLEDVLQTLLLSASSKANDHQLIELMTQLG